MVDRRAPGGCGHKPHREQGLSWLAGLAIRLQLGLLCVGLVLTETVLAARQLESPQQIQIVQHDGDSLQLEQLVDGLGVPWGMAFVWHPSNY